VTIPDKPAFKAGEVCELAQIQPYVLRSWESEFPDLGLSKTPGGPRIYRRVDVERVLRIRDLLFVEGLTLSGVRRRFESEQPQPQDDLFTFVAEVQAAQAKAQASAQAPAARHAKGARERDEPAPAAQLAASVMATPATSSPLASDTPEPAVPEQTRAQLVRLKLEMRSLLDLLGGTDAGATRAAPSAGPAPRRTRRA
jgi:DNA-binding transcriptional MerR regulator